MSVTLGKRKRQGEFGGSTTKSTTKPAIKSTTKPAAKSTAKSITKSTTPSTKAKIVPALPAQTASKVANEDEESDGEDVRAIFQRAFEARFKPIEVKRAKNVIRSRQEDDDDGEEEEDEELFDECDNQDVAEYEHDEVDEDESDFDGLSEHEGIIEVVEAVNTRRVANERLDKKQMKAFMSAKPPSSDSIPPTTSTSTTKQLKPAKDSDKPEDDGTDAANLKNDLALQRLLNESHLLDSTFASTDPTGKNRHKATDLRLLSLGSKASVLEQKSMPLSHRKGINAKKEMRETERRREAKENGIILERAALKRQNPVVGPPEKRARGIGGPSVGRFSGGTLRLSKQDVAGITGPKKTFSGKKGGKSGRSGNKSKW